MAALEIFVAVGGIAGLGLFVYFVLYRETARRLFERLHFTKNDSYKLVRLFMVLTFLVFVICAALFIYIYGADRDKNEKIAQCIDEKLKGVLTKKFTHPGEVDCPGGGCFLNGNCNKREDTVSFPAPTGYYISEYRLIQGASNDGATGDLKAEKDSENRVTGISAYIACDPADYPGADGGWNKISLEGELRYANSEGLIAQARQVCAASTN